MSAPLNLDNPFWRFSLAVYAAPGVQQECLALQTDYALDVNVLLFAAWLGSMRVALKTSDLDAIEEAAKSWARETVHPLRHVRQTMKTMSAMSDPAVQALRKKVAAAELHAEQIEQALLYAGSDDFNARDGATTESALRGNVALLLQRHGAAPDACAALLAAASAPLPNRAAFT